MKTCFTLKVCEPRDKLMKMTAIYFLILFSTITASANKLNYQNIVDINQYKGQTYFSLMREVIKPALDEVATEGFYLTSGQKAIDALKVVDSKVSRSAMRAAGNSNKLKQATDSISSRREKITFYELPELLNRAGIGSGRFDLTTYLALVSGAGIAVKINAQNIAYNVNYGTGKVENDERTGRSFGEASGRLALDASDKHYLQILENYIKKSPQNTERFYRSILSILLNNDISEYALITPEGQAVATDFFAVYTAEQNRHLMSHLQRHPWDEALLEVTLLSAFHAGQDRIQLIFNGELTDTTVKQQTGCSTEDKILKRASLIDYWQFSKSTNPESCTRSGLNINRRDFRNLGAALTAFQREKNPALVERVERHFKSSKGRGNVFAQLSNLLINYSTPKRLDAETLELAKDFTAFLMQVKADANAAHSYIDSRIRNSNESDGDENSEDQTITDQ